MSVFRSYARVVRSVSGLLSLCVILLCPSIIFGQSSDKLDPILKRFLTYTVPGQTSTLHPLIKTTGIEPTTDVFIRTTDGTAAFRTPGVRVKTVTGNIIIATVPLHRLQEVAAEPHVRSVHAAKIWKPLLDKSVPETKADSVYSPYGVSGRGIIVGVIDTGIDWDHLDFRTAADPTKTRIKFLWDMSDDTGPPPSGAFAGSGGTEYNENDINEALAGGATVRAADPVGHGTHVAGIAAGNGGGSAFVGMAPEADLVIVKAIRGDNQGFSSTDVVTALNYIDTKATALGKPYVVNLSLGGQQGPHDGRSAEAEGIDGIVGSGINGKAAVVAAGNDGNDGIHASGTLISSVVAVERSFIAESGTSVSIDIWTQITHNNNPNQVFITVAGPDTSFGPVSGVPPSPTQADLPDGFITVFSSPFSDGDINTDVNIVVKKSGTWTLKIQGNKNQQGDGRFDMWIYNGHAEFIPAHADTTTLVGAPGAANNAITVGAYVSRASWTDANSVTHTATANSVPVVPGDAAAFSSPGPTRDGRLKPEISAPGQIIGATRSADAIPGNGASIFNDINILPGNTHAVSQGTSMSTPHVTGAVALVLQEAVKQGMSFDAIQIREALQTTAWSDVATGVVPNDIWGYGKMDVDSLFAHLFGPPVPRVNAQTVQTDTSTVLFAASDGSQATVKFQVGGVAGDTLTYENFGSDLPSSVQGDPPPSFPLQYFDLRSTIPNTTAFEAVVTVKYTDTQLTDAGGPAESTLRLLRFNEADSTWRHLNTTVDTVANTVSATTTAFSTWSLASVTPTGIETPDFAPSSYALEQNFPNPFNPETTIRYTLREKGPVRLVIYNIMGQTVRTLVDGVQPAGRYRVFWDGKNVSGRPVASGVYLYRLSAGAFSESKQMLLLK